MDTVIYISATWIFLGNLMEYFVSVNHNNKHAFSQLIDVLKVIHSLIIEWNLKFIIFKEHRNFIVTSVLKHGLKHLILLLPKILCGSEADAKTKLDVQEFTGGNIHEE